jgi:hypothetical protein
VARVGQLATQKGRETFEYFNSIKKRLENYWVRPDHYMIQFISGHGDFNSKLRTFRLSEVDTWTAWKTPLSTYWKTVKSLMKNDRICGTPYRNWSWTGRRQSGSSSPKMYTPTSVNSQEVFCRQRNKREVLQEMMGPLQQGRPPEKSRRRQASNQASS